MMHLREELEKRGFLHQFTHEEAFDIYDKGGRNFYFGADLSADSLTIGNFCALMQVFHIMKKWNMCYLIVGGATSTIGNPSGKDAERPILSAESLAYNQENIWKQFDYLTKRAAALTGKKFEYVVMNNYDFFKDMNVVEFMRDVGKYITVNRMMNKDIVRRRITDPEKSISFAEFSYMLLMGYDFYRLYSDFWVELQVGGSDEWDGILSGIELIHKKLGKTAYGITNKLILDSNGKKFGKSEGNAIWVDRRKNSPYFAYQYFLNTTDEDVERFLKLFTFYSFEEINDIVEKHFQNPQERYGQRMLASYVLKLIFDEQAVEEAEKISNLLFWNEDKLELMKNMSDSEIAALKNETGGVQLEVIPMNICDAIVATGLESSKGNAKKAIEAWAIYLNEEKIEKIDHEIQKDDLINSKVALLRKGKKNFKLLTQ